VQVSTRMEAETLFVDSTEPPTQELFKY